MASPATAVKVVYVARGFPWMKTLFVIILVLWLFYRYFIAPVLAGIDKVTPWEGVVPFISCGAPPAPVQDEHGFDAMWYDLGAGVRKLAAGPPSAQQMVGWFSKAGSETSETYALVKAGAEGRPRPLGLAPEPTPTPGLTQVGDSGVEAFIASIVEQESGGSYSALGKVIPKTGDRAYGKYQVMGANVGPWSERYLGQRLTPQQYLASPQAQDAIARAHLAELYTQHGARGAAAAWYSGQPNKHMDTKPQFGGPSIKGYVDEVVGRMSSPPVHTVQPVDSNVCDEPAAGLMYASVEPGGPWGGHSNGNIPASELCAVPGAPAGEKGMLRCDAAQSWVALAGAFQAHFGQPLPFGNGYRSYQRQVELKAEKGRWAAKPGTSTHGWGLAVDTAGPAGRFRTPEHEWLRANAGRFGWYHPEWAREGGKLPEPWHWEYGGSPTMEAG